MQIVTRNIADLKPHPRNYRQHPPIQLAKLADSLRFHKQPKPVVITDDNLILAGHGLVEAAKLAGWTSIECSIYEGENPEAFLVMDNRSATFATDDQQLFAELLNDLRDDSNLLLASGFDDGEIAILLKELGENTKPADFAPATEDEQGRLDEKKLITCPECGHEFTR